MMVPRARDALLQTLRSKRIDRFWLPTETWRVAARNRSPGRSVCGLNGWRPASGKDATKRPPDDRGAIAVVERFLRALRPTVDEAMSRAARIVARKQLERISFGLLVKSVAQMCGSPSTPSRDTSVDSMIVRMAASSCLFRFTLRNPWRSLVDLSGIDDELE